jgi:large subunit ribosomal protein L11
MGVPLPVVIRVFRDKSFDFEVKSPPAAFLLKQAAGVAKGSGVPNKEKVGKVTRADVEEIAKKKLRDLNARDIEQAMRIIEGTARSAGIEVEG